ncbi:hypothetical protein KUV73_20395 [Mameliella alba]|nr:hypothetical protein [Mameliella alba]MBY6171519.1 hypothetical protein [Mameliella alba]MBY6176743.1 hypothetical protein [Mameliella alba]
MSKGLGKKRKLGNADKTLLTISLGVHAIWLVLFGYLLFATQWKDDRPTLVKLVGELTCPGCASRVDPISVAYQLGRLDLVAMSLTLLGVVLAIAAFGGILEVRRAAQQAASDEAKELVAAQLPNLLTPEVLTKALLQDPRAMYTLTAALREADPDGGIDPSVADDIADAFNGGDDEE